MRLFGRTSIRPFEAKPQIEVDEELRFHLEQRVRDYVARGMDPAAARSAALERFGDLTGVRSECTQLLEEDRRAERRRDWMEDLRQDIRSGGVRCRQRDPAGVRGGRAARPGAPCDARGSHHCAAGGRQPTVECGKTFEIAARAIDKPLAQRPSSGAAYAERRITRMNRRCTSRFSCSPSSSLRPIRHFVAFAIPRSRRMAASSYRSMVTSISRPLPAARGAA